jgi:hypothetical protein
MSKLATDKLCSTGSKWGAHNIIELSSKQILFQTGTIIMTWTYAPFMFVYFQKYGTQGHYSFKEKRP